MPRYATSCAISTPAVTGLLCRQGIQTSSHLEGSMRKLLASFLVLATLAPAMAKRAQDQAAAVHAQWLADTKADKEIGGEKLSENLAIAKKAIDAKGDVHARVREGMKRKLANGASWARRSRLSCGS